MTKDKEQLAQLFDHTNLKPYSTTGSIELLCRDAIENNFYSVCVYGYWVSYIRENYPDLKIVQVLNFPDGLSLSNTDTLAQIQSDANEYDIVMNISKLKERKLEELVDELKTVKSYIGKKVLKIIIETPILTPDDLYTAIDVVAESGADFVKTATGTILQSAENLIEQVAHISSYIKLHNYSLEIKASGGIKSLSLVKVLIGLGCTRIGSSNSVQILKELGD